MASRGKRHTTRHTKPSGGVSTAKLGAVQRRILVTLFHLAWDKGKPTGTDPTDVWVPWQPKRHHMPEGTPAEAVSASKALAALEQRRLLMVRRHEGGRAYAVRLTQPGFRFAMELLPSGRTREQVRREQMKSDPPELRRAVPLAYREVKRSDISDERRTALQDFLDLYRRWSDKGDGAVFTELWFAFKRLTS